MNFIKSALVAATVVAAAQAHAGYVYSFGAVPADTYTAPSFSDGVKASVESTSVVRAYLQPEGVTGDYLVVSSRFGSEGSATIDTGTVSSYSFVWGSPDSYNIVDIYSSATTFVEYTGVDLGNQFGMFMDGDNANTGLFTITGTDGTTIDHLVLKSTGVAFEVATAVPEPETYALMLAGLAAMAFVARRRQRGA